MEVVAPLDMMKWDKFMMSKNGKNFIYSLIPASGVNEFLSLMLLLDVAVKLQGWFRIFLMSTRLL